MEIFTRLTSVLGTNTYIVVNGTRGFVVDPGGDGIEIAHFMENKGVKLEAILITHGHFDHIGGVAELCENSKSPSPYILMHKDDADKISSFRNLGIVLNAKVKKFVPDVLLAGDETLNVAGLSIKVLYTPGHSKGGVCYAVENALFSGDTLFAYSYGRTDFYDGDFYQLKNSILNKLFNLKGDFEVYPGHGEKTLLSVERQCNPIRTDVLADD